jgi:hypothetical protein
MGETAKWQLNAVGKANEITRVVEDTALAMQRWQPRLWCDGTQAADTAISQGESTEENSECHRRHHKRDLCKEEAGETEGRLKVHKHCEV